MTLSLGIRDQLFQRASFTAVQSTASGTAFDFNSIPSWVKEISVLFDSVSLSGTDSFLIQLGDTDGVETTGYTSMSGIIFGSSASQGSATSGFTISGANAAHAVSGIYNIINLTGNVWVGAGVISKSAGTAGFYGGTKTLSAALDRLRVTRTGSNTFDGGQIGLLLKG